MALNHTAVPKTRETACSMGTSAAIVRAPMSSRSKYSTMSGLRPRVKAFTLRRRASLRGPALSEASRPGESTTRTLIPWISPRTSVAFLVAGANAPTGAPLLSALPSSNIELIVALLPTPVLPSARMVSSKLSSSPAASTRSAATRGSSARDALGARPTRNCSASDSRYITWAITEFPRALVTPRRRAGAAA